MDITHEIWFPSIYITNALKVDKLGSFGGDDMVSLWYKDGKGNSIFQYSEVITVIIHSKLFARSMMVVVLCLVGA